MTNLNDIGTEFHQPPLDAEGMDPNPITQFEKWILTAIERKEQDPNAMTLATVDNTGHISARIMLLKYFDQNGFVFFTNYESAKAQALAQNPNAALVFWWPKSEWQVRVEGKVRRLDEKHSDEYFHNRSRASQIAASISKQSHPVSSAQALKAAFDQLKIEHEGKTLPRPTFWGGYLLEPQKIEFWQGRPFRLHDRIVYQKENGLWSKVRLSP